MKTGYNRIFAIDVVSFSATVLLLKEVQGDNEQLGIIPWRQEHYFQPDIMLHLPNGLKLNTAFAIGLTDASDDMMRIMLMKMF